MGDMLSCPAMPPSPIVADHTIIAWPSIHCTPTGDLQSVQVQFHTTQAQGHGPGFRMTLL